MQHVKLYEQFINEALKEGRDQDLANEIIAVLYAEGNTQAQEQMYLSGWNKDAVKELHGSKVRVPSQFMLGTLITVAADNGKSYYFDGSFVEGDKNVTGTKVGMPFTKFIDILVKKKIINKPS